MVVRDPFIHTFERLAGIVNEALDEIDASKEEIAAKANVSVFFIEEIAAAHPRAELGRVVSVLEALGVKPRALPALPQYMFDETGSLRSEYDDDYT